MTREEYEDDRAEAYLERCAARDEAEARRFEREAEER